MTGPFLAAAAQFRINAGATDGNAVEAFRHLEDAASAGARLCVLPELWSSGFDLMRTREHAKSTPDILFQIRSFAASHKIVVVGSLPERVGGAVYNTVYVVNANGVVTGEYRKAHLFTPSGEHLGFRAGRSSRAIPTDVGVIGPLLCYDLRFPELARKLVLDGADILCVCAQWPVERIAHWNTLLPARALENQCPLVASNGVGPAGTINLGGGSAIFSCEGRRIAGSDDAEGVVLGRIDPAETEDFRRRIPCLFERNEPAYRRTRRGKSSPARR